MVSSHDTFLAMSLSSLHETLLQMFRSQPHLLLLWMEKLLSLKLPSYSSFELRPGDFTQSRPIEFRADLVLVLKHKGKNVLGLVIEIQLRWDPMKQWTWPVYAATLSHQLKCPVEVLVVTPSASVAKRCADPIRSGGLWLQPKVLGPQSIPLVTRLQHAKSNPELGVLSVLAHGKTEQGWAVAEPVLGAMKRVDIEPSEMYIEAIWRSLSPGFQQKMEAMMKKEGFRYKNPIFQQWMNEGLEKGLEKGRSQGKTEGLAQGEARGMEKGLAQGETRGKASTLLTFLEARGWSVSAPERKRIDHCKDMSKLEQWVRRAATASSLQEVFS